MGEPSGDADGDDDGGGGGTGAKEGFRVEGNMPVHVLGRKSEDMRAGPREDFGAAHNLKCKLALSPDWPGVCYRIDY